MSVHVLGQVSTSVRLPGWLVTFVEEFKQSALKDNF